MARKSVDIDETDLHPNTKEAIHKIDSLMGSGAPTDTDLDFLEETFKGWLRQCNEHRETNAEAADEAEGDHGEEP